MVAINAGLIPTQLLSPERVLEIERAVDRTLIDQAMAGLALPEDSLVVRDVLTVNDLEFTYEDWKLDASGYTVNAYNNILASTYTVPQRKYIGWYGVELGDVDQSVTSAIKFSTAAGDKDIWNIQKLRSYEIPAGMAREPITFKKEASMKISYYVLGTPDVEDIVLKGRVCEPVEETLGE